MTEKNSYIGVVLSVVLATIVTFLVASIIIKTTFKESEDEDLKQASEKMKEMKSQSKATTTKVIDIEKIIFACDAGMGSSAMGTSIFKKLLKEKGLDIKVDHCAINEIPEDVKVIVAHESLIDRIKEKVPNARIFKIKNFMNNEEYINIINQLK